jgi:hypothetical protein
MSRDTFNHVDVRIKEFAESLDRLIFKESTQRWPLETHVQDKLREIAAQAHRLAALAEQADLLFSDDIGSDAFMQCVLEIEAPRGVDIEV